MTGKQGGSGGGSARRAAGVSDDIAKGRAGSASPERRLEGGEGAARQVSARSAPGGGEGQAKARR